MTPEHAALVEQACRENAWSQKDVARIIGCSLRTVQRHVRNYGLQYQADHHLFIKAAHPRNPGLAAQLAAALGTNLEALDLVPPKGPPPPPALPPPPPAAKREHADAVVSAAADALNLVPRDARPIVAAIFARVSELEVDLPGLVKLLKGSGNAPPKAVAKR